MVIMVMIMMMMVMTMNVVDLLVVIVPTGPYGNNLFNDSVNKFLIGNYV